MTLLVRGKFNVNNHAHVVKGICNETAWFYYYFSHRDLTPYLTRQGAGRFKLTKQGLAAISCVIPPPDEQRAIAGALSDVDGLLGALDQLIAKKRDLKQAAMQQLLTGHQRLPGFAPANRRLQQTNIGLIPEDWHIRPLGEVVEFLDGQRRPIKDSERAQIRGEYPYYGASGIVDYVNDYLFDEELILLGEDGHGRGDRGRRSPARQDAGAQAGDDAGTPHRQDAVGVT